MADEGKWFEWIVTGGLTMLSAGITALVGKVIHTDKRVAKLETAVAKDLSHAQGDSDAQWEKVDDLREEVTGLREEVAALKQGQTTSHELLRMLLKNLGSKT